VEQSSQSRSKLIVAVVFAIFFVISFVTNILGPIIPDMIQSFHLSLFTAALLPFSFFIAYGVFSIPAGFLVERWREKSLIVTMFFVALAGSLLFASLHVFPAAIASLFIIGTCMAALQVAINPLLRVAGGEEHFAFNSAFAQLVFGIASFLSPQVYSYVVRDLQNPAGHSPLLMPLAAIVPANMRWISMYWIFAIVIAAMIAVLIFLHFPAVERKEDESAGTIGMYRELLAKPVVWLYFVSVFFYVSSEQGTANWMSEFLWKYHGFDPQTTGAWAVGLFWGLMTVGCFIGMILLKLLDSRVVLGIFSVGALTCLSLALFGPAQVSRVAFPCIGLFASVMWPIVISLGLNSVERYQGALAGILCTGIMGGAIMPLVEGRIADSFGLRTGMCLLYVTFGWVFSVALWARPLIGNQRFGAATE
jgi:fucose permease